MASLEDLLGKTMLFTAAKDSGLDPMKALRVAPGAPIAFSPPYLPPPALDDLDPANQAIWHWKHNAAAPAKVEAISAFVRAAGPTGMPMPVCTSVEVESVTIKVKGNDSAVDLPLTPKYVLTKFFLDAATLRAQTNGWWRLPANLDRSMLVVFGYELIPASGAAPKPLDMAQIEGLKSRFFPDPDVSASDPDAPEAPSSHLAPPAIVGIDESVTAYLTPTWVIVTFSFTTCKERTDFEPGEILGAARMYPHVMVTCNEVTAQVEAKIHVARPLQTMPHDAEMQLRMGALAFADTNTDHRLLPGPPLPVWSNFFDYYQLDLPIGREFSFVDATKTGKRNVVGAIRRERSAHVPTLFEEASPFEKRPRQGAFDNLHLAPRMRFSGQTPDVQIANIAMAPFCIHDCLHTHTRWGNPGGDAKVFNLGFNGRQPYAADLAPLVPGNQSVFISLTGAASFRYRALARGPVKPGTFSVFYHHGSAYALAVASPTIFGLARFGVHQYAELCVDPYVDTIQVPNPMGASVVTHVMRDVRPTASVAAFYHRLRFMGESPNNKWVERIQILDLEKCVSS